LDVLGPFVAIVDGLVAILQIPSNAYPQNRIPPWIMGRKFYLRRR